jgi:hypothetical protein
MRTLLAAYTTAEAPARCSAAPTPRAALLRRPFSWRVSMRGWGDGNKRREELLEAANKQFVAEEFLAELFSARVSA